MSMLGSTNEERQKPEYIYPRMYAALPDVGEADVSLSHDDSPVETTLAADIIIMYAYDMGAYFEIISNSELKRLGLTVQELHKVALANLDSLNLEVRAHENGRVRMLTAGGDFEATLLLLPYVWDSVASMVQGDVVAAIPARDLIFFTGTGDREGLSEMRSLTSKMLEQADKPLSRYFFSSHLQRMGSLSWSC
ncbi:MAG: DUF1444 family protein [Verrucomicrobiaceae bacterium]